MQVLPPGPRSPLDQAPFCRPIAPDRGATPRRGHLVKSTPNARLRRIAVVIAVLGVIAGSLASTSGAAAATPVTNGLPQAAASGLGWASPNWSGYAVTAGPYTSATGTWIVPAVRPTATASYSSTWVGIDGFENSSLIQVGTAQSYHDGAAFYSAWWEILPATARTITTVAVKPGDTVSATITKATSDTWTITLRNATTGVSFATTETYAGPGASAEWIQEAPNVSGNLTKMAAYGSTTITATANGRSPGLAARNGGAMIQGGIQVSVPGVPDATAGRFTVYATAVPGAPVLVARGLGSRHGIRLTWSAAASNGSSVVAYRIYRRASLTSTSRTLVATVGSVLTWTDLRNPAKRTSTYEVVAVNGVGAGPASKAAGAYSR